MRGYLISTFIGGLRLSVDGDGTAIVWTGSLEPLIPGTGALVLAFARNVVRLFAKELVRFADELQTQQ
jgi:hypothetical protein